MYAIAQLQGSGIEGVVRMYELRSGTTLVQVIASGVPDGQHGLHVHQFGDRSNGCESMGSHYSRAPSRHGGRRGAERHTGDLGNVRSVNGNIYTMFVMQLRIKELLGRGIVLHADPDDLGRGGAPESETTGNSGKRIACGVIALGDAKALLR